MTPERNQEVLGFLRASGWHDAERRPLAGDASMRRYERLTRISGDTTILMDAPPEMNPDISPFVAIARHLRATGLSAPRVLNKDSAQGFLLLEDLGDDLFARIIPDHPQLENPLYKAATDVLIALHSASPPRLTRFTPEIMSRQASLVLSTWVRPVTGSQRSQAAEFSARFHDLLHGILSGNPVMILRDYHAENLLWLPDRACLARVGLLDFQDAMLAHPAYDLVSLLQDVRRDVSGTVEQSMIARYIAKSGQDDRTFRTAYAILGVQRNLRILAVFARLAGTMGKPRYTSLMPRTWAHVMRGLAHPALSPVATILRDILPEPTPENLKKLVPA